MTSTARKRRLNLYDMPKHLAVEEAAHRYWKVQRQWLGQADEGKSLTVSQANTLLREILVDYRMPSLLLRRVRTLQNEIILNNKGPKKAKQKQKQKTFTGEGI